MTAVLHTLVVIAVLAAYTTLTALGYDGNALLTVLAGQGVGAGIQALGNRGA